MKNNSIITWKWKTKKRNCQEKHLLFWKTDCWGEVVAYRRWSQLEVWLYSKACRLSNTNTIFNFSVGWVWKFSGTTQLTITLTVKKRLTVTVITTHRILKLKINIDMYIPVVKNCSMKKALHFILKLTSVSQFLNSSGKEFQCYYCSMSERSTVQ